MVEFPSAPAFSLEIVVLKRSRLVLQMKVIEHAKPVKASREQYTIYHFKKAFRHYFWQTD